MLIGSQDFSFASSSNAMQLKCNTGANSVRCSIAVDQNILTGYYLFEKWFFNILLKWNDID